ncbi:hypothetical protein Glove_367g22 [Diversispora epigaea]|uniref:Uncharacterized protein n=1 Tax=Diversispora epigaea TaxID=1348612 RepID=A0A397HAA3_9GLOM|nr:hypothetical protein Glove_367g22 [Diversispora epigaea]
MQKNQKVQQNQDQIDPNDPFETKEILRSRNKYVVKCCFYNENYSDDGDDDEESFFEFLSDDDVEYECYNCKRVKYEDKKRGRGEEVKRRRRR